LKELFMTRSVQLLITLSILWAGSVCGDGLMIPADRDYPKEFLRNRMTRIEVDIDGLIARTSVYQEFVNEWELPTDAVYSFPLPEGARATRFVYWFEGQAYQAVIEETEQALNPGTGEGGTAAEVNRYIDLNGISISLKSIGPGEIQRVRLDYIQLCDFFQGRCDYKYPLDTANFITYPIDQLEFVVSVQSNSPIVDYSLPSHPNFELLILEDRDLALELNQPHAYLNADLEFSYTTDRSQLGVDFYSVAGDTADGHFALFVRPPDQAASGTALPKRIFFLLSTSSRAFGALLAENIEAISRSLDLLTPNDLFNIIPFSNSITTWRDAAVPATPENIAAAKEFLATVTSRFGSRTDLALDAALAQIPDDRYANAVLLFDDGFSAVDPHVVEQLNSFRAGIFPVGIGDQLFRPRLETMAALNYGFVTYIDDEDPREEIVKLFRKLSQPVLTNTAIEYGKADLSGILPEKVPAIYAGSYFFTTGRYSAPGSANFSISGLSTEGIKIFDGQLDFTSRRSKHRFVRSLWAKETIDELERQMALSGEVDPLLKEQVVALSQTYNLRSRFTAYIADYQTLYVPEEELFEFTDGGFFASSEVGLEPTAISGPVDIEVEDTAESALPLSPSFIAGNYPNPFNAGTTIRLFLADAANGRTKLLKIYSALGQLVAVIDISHLPSGWHELPFDGTDLFGRPLGSGIYFVQLQIHNRAVSALRISLLK